MQLLAIPLRLVRSKEKLLATLDFTRPFTLIAPLFGFISGGLCAYGVGYHHLNLIDLMQVLVTGGVAASMLNIGSNGLNQIFDLRIDMHNKPDRALPSKKLTLSEAYFVTLFAYSMALIMAYFIGMETLFIFIAATICTYWYSVWPRTKKHWLAANVTIASARGVLLKVAGWSAVATIFNVEPWLIGLIFGLFLLGASSTKDFSDLEGDRLGGCITLPVKFGV
ncbi:MAG: UbiA family prenyltransferase, partial [Bacteroidota bacterium]